MKKFIFIMVAMFATLTMNAQNYAGSSKFTDNWSVTVQGGVVTPLYDFFDNGSTTPTVLIGVDKYVTPWLGFGVEGRTSIGTGNNYNIHTAFDLVNVSGIAKINLVNLFDFDGTRKTFEPVLYGGLGWGHINCSNCVSLSDNYHAVNGAPTENLGLIKNFLTYRVGLEIGLNLGQKKNWGIVVSPSVVWGNIDNARLSKMNGNFEISAGAVYHFTSSNGSTSMSKIRPYDQAEVDALNAKINELQNRPVRVVEKIVEKVSPTAAVDSADKTYQVGFEQNSSELSDVAKAVLDKVPAGATVNVAGSTSPEGTVARNTELAVERAQAVADYLQNRGVKINTVEGGEAGRSAVVTVQ